ncbi:phosphodiester glycosidase family protein [Sinomonas gamaensis]|uniref:phosphodiester glycosidase family protein n=1 Tax=Sinomonas gamaensis TaxID=2565624 RepID=UPI001107D342|nr:phosphodiester glycosidase family protein [Sinomonas gamaensis]
MRSTRTRKSLLAATAALTVSSALLTPASASQAAQTSAPVEAAHLNLGAQDLPETRTQKELAPGVTLTAIHRGGTDSSLFWTAEVAIPSTSPDPDAPASALSDQATAQAVAAKLQAAGVVARVEQVVSPQLADAGGPLGYRVRAGEFAQKADGAAVVNQIKAAGYASSVVYSGWDGDLGTSSQTRGPWNLDVITIDPKQYHGELAASFGPDLEKPETTSQLAAAQHAIAGTNAGFFVFDPAAGAPGDPAGVGVYDGQLLREPVGNRPGLILNGANNRTSIERLTWKGSLDAAGATLPLTGLNRAPGLIRNCGEKGDQPTEQPQQDVTCTNADELVAFTPQFGATSPAGTGLEVTLDAHDTVTSVSASRGATIPTGGHTVQAAGSEVEQLRALAHVGQKLKVSADVLGEDGKSLMTTKDTSVVNGGPLLVKDGQEDVTVRQDGMVHRNDANSFYYGWVHKRNPRTFAGTDAEGRTLLVTADGRSTSSLGLSLKEEADVAQSLGMVQAMNLDGGGSTTAVAQGAVVNTPSGTAERPVGDAILVLPTRTDSGGSRRP